ncbi:hypothetical protein PYW07_006859 [Mythimna separata]|uniref:Uncharacterized protein n=1 Tax=Mythimna separata TaxID=271217 RepID=A0AAD7Z2E5_MYTSE|nr:hypothetical protein PYW07_006859 [Mythimna separata]
MGRKAVLAVVWLAISQALCDKGSVTQSAAVKDNVSAESAPRLYRNVPLGVYASAAPYGSYSFQLPQFIAAPKAAASQVAPVQQKPANQNVNTYLMDSYGNRYFEGPQAAPYKAALPQQFVALQTKLPEHLAQPLVAASPNFQFKQSGPQVFFGAPFRVPALQDPAPTPLNQFPSFGQLVYAQNVQSLAPSSNNHNFGFKAPQAQQAQQQPTNNRAVFSSTKPHQQYGNNQNEQKFQRQQELPQVIFGKPKFQNGQESSAAPHGEAKFQRIQEVPHGAHGEVKFQRLRGNPSSEYSGPKFQRLQEKPHEDHGEVNTYQRFQEAPEIVHVEHTYDREESPKHQRGNDKARLQSAPAKQTTVTYVNDINGDKSVVKVQSEPLPLLDLTLLEPLTFANPLVPQVQHFLPRISQATYQKLPQAAVDEVKNYQKEFVVQKTMSYDNEKPQKHTHKKKEKKPTYSNKHAKNDAPRKATGPQHETFDEAPEIVYEINMPGHKETISEKSISYNKETQSEPVHYTYGSKSEKEPVTYSFSRSSKEPYQVKNVNYHGNGQNPQHLIYNFKPEEKHEHQHDDEHEEEHEHNRKPHHENHSENQKHSHDSEDGDPGYRHNYKEHPKSSEELQEPAHKEQGHHRESSREQHESSREQPESSRHHHESSREQHESSREQPESSRHHHESSREQHESSREQPESSRQRHESSREHPESSRQQHEPAQKEEVRHNGPANQHYLEPITKEYEEDIRLLANAQIKVDPSQHVQRGNSEGNSNPEEAEQSSEQDEQSQAEHSDHPSSQQKHSHHSQPQQSHHHYSAPHSEPRRPPPTHIHEKSKRIIIHEEAPDERHMHQEQMKVEALESEENNEEDFEKAYKNAAVGFPAFSKQALEAAEKDIFDPNSYGVSPDHVEYSIDQTPFQQYQEEGDEYPKEARSTYKDSRDRMKEDYYADYSISKPESLIDRYQNKAGYYKLYKQQRPEYYVPEEDEDDKKKKKPKFEKYSVAPTYGFPSAKQEKKKSSSYYGNHKPKQQLYEYDYSKGAPRDSSAYASRPYQSYKTKTNFVEPQFQYGFEPISIPKIVLDSELAAMASNHKPESEKPGMRKKVYKENWYIKKTSTADGVPAS